MKTFQAWNIALLTLVCASAHAEETFDRYVADVRLLMTNEVKAELKVTQAQRDKMNAAAKNYNALAARIEEKARKGQKASDSEQKQLDSEIEKMRNGVLNALSASQILRLREITLQVNGLQSLADDRVAKRVGLSSSQVSKIRNLLQSALQKSVDIRRKAVERIEAQYKDKKPKTDAEKQKLAKEIEAKLRAEMKRVQPQIDKVETDARNAIVKVMTPGQQQVWDSLLGKPFKPK